MPWRTRILVLSIAMAAGSACTLQLAQVRVNNVVDSARYDSIEIGRDRVREVLASLGPPDRVVYGRTDLVFDYLWMRHRGTDARLFFPSGVLPGFDPFFILSIPRAFFDPASLPEEFEHGALENTAHGMAQLPAALVPFGSGQDLLIATGHQVRHDRVRIVFDRETLVAHEKSMRAASGDYRHESLTSRILLQAE